MKHCSRCRVDVLGSLDNCPLCGGFLDEQGTACSRYRDEIEPCVQYPALKIKDNVYRSLLSLKALLLILIVSFICVFINVSLNPDSLWSAYLAVGGLAVYFSAISAVYRKRRFYAQIALNALIVPLAAFAFDMIFSWDTAGNLSRFGVSLSYVVPILFLCTLVLTDVMIFADRRENKYYLVTLLFVSLLSLVPQLTVWAASRPFYEPLAVSLFFASLINGVVLVIICWKEIKKEVRRKFFF